MTGTDLDITELLNAQTARMGWDELERHFARGVVVCVEPGQDLLAVAEQLVCDDSAVVDQLVAQGLIRRAQDNEAMQWHQNGTVFWVVVVAPWVLIQPALPGEFA